MRVRLLIQIPPSTLFLFQRCKMKFYGHYWKLPIKILYNSASIRTAFGFRIRYVRTWWLFHKMLFKMWSRQKMQNKNLATFCEELVDVHMDVTLLDSWQVGLGILQACFFSLGKKSSVWVRCALWYHSFFNLKDFFHEPNGSRHQEALSLSRHPRACLSN